MARLRVGKGKRRKAPATVFFTSENNDEGKRQICVYARCDMSDKVVGPVWGHADQSIRRALAELTSNCDCPAGFHNAREYQGKRITGKGRKSRS